MYDVFMKGKKVVHTPFTPMVLLYIFVSHKIRLRCWLSNSTGYLVEFMVV